MIYSNHWYFKGLPKRKSLETYIMVHRLLTNFKIFILFSLNEYQL